MSLATNWHFCDWTVHQTVDIDIAKDVLSQHVCMYSFRKDSILNSMEEVGLLERAESAAFRNAVETGRAIVSTRDIPTSFISMEQIPQIQREIEELQFRRDNGL